MAASRASSKSEATDAGAATGNRRTTANQERDSVTERIDQLTDILGDEFFQSVMAAWAAKVDRDYEMTSKQLFDQEREALAYLADSRNLRHQHMQNAVTQQNNSHNMLLENMNLTIKQFLKTEKIGDDRMWNIDEQGNQAIAALAKLADLVKSTEGTATK